MPGRREQVRDRGERLVELVREARRQRAHRVELRQLDEAKLRLAKLREGILGTAPLGADLHLVAPPLLDKLEGELRDRRAVRPLADARVQQHGHALPRLRLKVERDLGRLAPPREERVDVRVEVQAAGRCEQLPERGTALELATAGAEPRRERAVRMSDDTAVAEQRISERRLVEQTGDVPRRARRPLLAAHGSSRRKARIASAVSRGALRFGQCPVARSWTKRLPAMFAWT